MLRRRSRKRNATAIRLTISYRGNEIRLESRHRVETMAPPSDDTAGQEGEAGFWYDLRDSRGRVLYRRVTQNPIRYDAEVLLEDTERPFTRQRVADPQGTFSLLVPDLPEARTLVMSSSPSDPAEAHQPAKEIAQFDLA